MTTAVAVPLPAKKERIPVNGHPIHGRLVQNVVYGLVIAVLAACFVAGGYYIVLQIKYGTINGHALTLKHWWDHLFKSPSWYLYRHGVRNLGEPAVATFAVKTVMAPPAWWRYRAGPVRLVATPFIVLAVTLAMIVGGIWVIDFGLPNAWHAVVGHPWHGPAISALGRLSLPELLLGVVIGLVIHRIWAPAGATIQGFLIDRSVDRSRLHGGHIPLWVRLPLAPPPLRERWSWLMVHDEETQQVGKTSKWVILPAVAIVVVVTIVGILAKYYIAKGGHIPFLAP